MYDVIYLLEESDGSYTWCDSPAPGIDMEEEDAIKYIRADLVGENIKKLACLYQAAKDRQEAVEGTASENYYRGQVVAYGRAVKAASQGE